MSVSQNSLSAEISSYFSLADPASIHKKEKWLEIIKKIEASFKTLLIDKGPPHAFSEIKLLVAPSIEFKDSETYLKFTAQLDECLSQTIQSLTSFELEKALTHISDNDPKENKEIIDDILNFYRALKVFEKGLEQEKILSLLVQWIEKYKIKLKSLTSSPNELTRVIQKLKVFNFQDSSPKEIYELLSEAKTPATCILFYRNIINSAVIEKLLAQDRLENLQISFSEIERLSCTSLNFTHFYHLVQMTFHNVKGFNHPIDLHSKVLREFSLSHCNDFNQTISFNHCKQLAYCFIAFCETWNSPLLFHSCAKLDELKIESCRDWNQEMDLSNQSKLRSLSIIECRKWDKLLSLPDKKITPSTPPSEIDEDEFSELNFIPDFSEEETFFDKKDQSESFPFFSILTHEESQLQKATLEGNEGDDALSDTSFDRKEQDAALTTLSILARARYYLPTFLSSFDKEPQSLLPGLFRSLRHLIKTINKNAQLQLENEFKNTIPNYSNNFQTLSLMNCQLFNQTLNLEYFPSLSTLNLQGCINFNSLLSIHPLSKFDLIDLKGCPKFDQPLKILGESIRELLPVDYLKEDEKEIEKAIRYYHIGLELITNNDVISQTGAIDYVKKVLEIMEKFYNEIDRESLALAYDKLGNYIEKIKNFPNDPFLNSEALREINHYHQKIEALDFYQKALEIRTEKLGKEYFGASLNYDQLGYFCEATDRHTQALDYYLQALKIRIKSLGQDHLEVAQNYIQLGYFCERVQDNLVALKYYLKALEIKIECLGKNHLDVAQCYDNLSEVCKKMGQKQEALEYSQEAKEIRENLNP